MKRKGNQKVYRQVPRRPGVSGFRGVISNGSGFAARVYRGTQRVHLGTFETPQEAALAHDREARRIHGPRAVVNWPSWCPPEGWNGPYPPTAWQSTPCKSEK